MCAITVTFYDKIQIWLVIIYCIIMEKEVQYMGFFKHNALKFKVHGFKLLYGEKQNSAFIAVTYLEKQR